MIKEQRLTHFNVIRATDDARTLAEWQNRVQKLAAGTRSGIPVRSRRVLCPLTCLDPWLPS